MAGKIADTSSPIVIFFIADFKCAHFVCDELVVYEVVVSF